MEVPIARHHVVGQPNQQAFLFGSPDTAEVVLDLNKYRSNSDFESWPRTQQFMLRQEAPEGDPAAEAMFVVVHEPWLGSPKITAVKQLDTGDPTVLGLEISFGDRADTVFYSLGGEPAAAEANGLRFSGRVGCYAETADGRSETFVLDGTLAKAGTPTGGDGPSEGAEVGAAAAEEVGVEGEVIRSYRKFDGDDFDGFGVRLAAVAGATPPPDLAGAFAVVGNRGALTNVRVPEDFSDPGMVPRFYHNLTKKLSGAFEMLEEVKARNINNKLATLAVGKTIILLHFRLSVAGASRYKRGVIKMTVSPTARPRWSRPALQRLRTPRWPER